MRRVRGRARPPPAVAPDEEAGETPLEAPMGAPWEQLLNAVSPAAAVAVRMGVSSDESPETPAEEPQGGLMGAWQRRFALGRLSLAAATGNNAKGEHGLPLFRYRPARFSSRRVRRRVVFKNGECNVVQGNVAKRRRRYLQDIFTTLVDAQWRWTLLVFSLSFLLSWLGFATLWWLIALAHGDFAPTPSPPPPPAPTASGTTLEGSPAPEPEPAPVPESVPCVRELFGFVSCFLFSVETQHTIGYGSRSITEECPEAIFVLCLQSITGVMIQAFMVGIVFAKLSRPKKRTQTLLFSRHAVVCLRDGCLCLMFRVGDMRKSHIVEAHVRAQLIRQKVTAEGELMPFYQQEMRVGDDGDEERIFFIWPTTIVHRVDRASPLYSLSPLDLQREQLEIVVILEGVIESTGMTTQARSSYLPSEILWGHRFESLVTFKKETGEYEVDYSLFNNTCEVATPLCSARELDEQRQRLSDLRRRKARGRTDERLEEGLDESSNGGPSVAATPPPPLPPLPSMAPPMQKVTPSPPMQKVTPSPPLSTPTATATPIASSTATVASAAGTSSPASAASAPAGVSVPGTAVAAPGVSSQRPIASAAFSSVRYIPSALEARGVPESHM